MAPKKAAAAAVAPAAVVVAAPKKRVGVKKPVAVVAEPVAAVAEPVAEQAAPKKRAAAKKPATAAPAPVPVVAAAPADDGCDAVANVAPAKAPKAVPKAPVAEIAPTPAAAIAPPKAAVAPLAAGDVPTWDILDTYFTAGGGADCANPLVKHHVDSFNEFLDKKAAQIIHGFNPIQICHNYTPEIKDFAYKIYMNLTQPTRSKPIFTAQDGTTVVMTPNMARMNNLTYATVMYTDVHVITEVINTDGVTERRETTIPNVPIGKIPIMVRSKACTLTQMPAVGEGTGKYECRYDPGGYFLVSGNEKVVICQDRISENRTLVFAPNGNADGLSAEIRSMPDGVFLPPKTTSLHLSGKPNHLGRIIRLSTSFLRSEVPLFVMFRALGVEKDRDIMQHIVLDTEDPKMERLQTELVACADDASDTMTRDGAHALMLRILGTTGTPREYLEQPERARAILANTILNDFLPHVGPCLRKKALYLGYMVRKLMRIFLGYQDYDNRDSYIHKRIDTTGVLFSNLFRQCYGKMIKEMRNMVVRELHMWRANPAAMPDVVTPMNVHRFFKQTIIESGLRYALSTGNWGVKTLGSYQSIRQGVAQVLNRMSYLSAISHLRRINTPMEKLGKLVPPRKLDNTQFGMICPNETPEGAAVGLVKNMAMSTHITINMSSAYVREVLRDLGVLFYADAAYAEENAARAFLRDMGSSDSVAVTVNGDILGYTKDPARVAGALRHMKRTGTLSPTTAVVWDIQAGALNVNTDAGRMYRPLHVVAEGQLQLTRQLAARGEPWVKFSERKYFSQFVAPFSGDDEGFLEYMDTEELNHAMIAMFPEDLLRGVKVTALPPRYTHCEIHPSLMNGVLAANIPFMDHNQAPRNCYQCLWLEEPVLMADGATRKAIRDVVPGDEVLTVDPVTLRATYTTVIHQYVRPAEKPVYRVTTLSGRSVVVTQDHKFMTNQGWRDLLHFNGATLLVIYPSVAPSVVAGLVASAPAPAPPAPSLMVPVAPFLTTTGTPYIDSRLTTMGLLPLTEKSPNFNLLMRVFGFMKAHGVGTKFPDTEAGRLNHDELERDAAAIGFAEYGSGDMGFRALMMALETDRFIRMPAWLSAPLASCAGASALARYNFLCGFFGGGGQAAWVAKIAASLSALGAAGEAAIAAAGALGQCYNCEARAKFAMLAEFNRHREVPADFPALAANPKLRQVTYDDWVARSGVTPARGALLVPVLSLDPVRNCMISDITVASENHSFVGGEGFAVSNSAMGKQAVGVYASNFNQRIDTMAHVLNYPQKPLARTRLAKYTHNDDLPSGINAIVAIMTYSGYNQEDSVMINQSALDRGMFTSTYYKSYRDTLNKNASTGEQEIFVLPDPSETTSMKPYNYDKLSADGFVPKNTYVNGGDILIGKIMPHKIQGVIHPRDNSHAMKLNDEGNVDMNYIGVNADGYDFAKVRLRHYRKMVIGDKCSSRSAQKGSLGMVYREADMPFSKSGIVPDIIMNPHAIPSRMTMGQLMETLMGKAGCYLGALGDATPFTDCKVGDIAAVLEANGMERHGNEILYNGRTGEQIQTEIFIGPTMYQRLKHLVQDKIHSRGSSGPVVYLTRQPAEGRARNGGLRFGEMERDAKLAYGSASFIKEKFLDGSDAYRVFVCRGCGMFCTANPEKGIYKCNACKESSDIVQCRVPYALKLMFQELTTMGIAPRIQC
jgi:DNA-directed RNA polymerase beta subunit